MTCATDLSTFLDSDKNFEGKIKSKITYSDCSNCICAKKDKRFAQIPGLQQDT